MFTNTGKFVFHVVRSAITVLFFSFAILAFSAIPTFASHAVDSTFGSLFGKWKGKGVIVLSADKPEENITCRLNYTRVSDSKLNAGIRCATVDFKIDAKGDLTYNKISNSFHGRLKDQGTGWTLILVGGKPKEQQIRFGLGIPEVAVNGWLDIDNQRKSSHSWFAQRVTPAGLKLLLRIKFQR